jgi:hypothetical protein
MATRIINYRYTIELIYLNIVDGVGTKIKNECIKSLIIDYDYDNLVMPKLYLTLKIDKSLADHMVKNCNDNLFTLALNKYDDLTDSKEEINCFRKKFTYFMTNDVNQNDTIDYNDATEEENKENTYVSITIGLLCLDHVNNNKNSVELNLKNATMPEIVKTVMSDFNPLILEPIPNSEKFTQFLLPVKDSINKTLQSLNDYRVLYDTPYRFYQDFNYTYLISSSGKPVQSASDKYSSVVINIKEITDNDAYDIGFIDNPSSAVYEIPISYSEAQVFDNTIANKSQSSIQAVSSSGMSKAELSNQNSYLTEKTNTTRLNNDNTNMLKNIEADSNNNNIFVYIGKNGLDTNIFSINKRISVNHIDRYKEHNGDYLLYRKREVYTREDETFILTSGINLRKIG